MILLLSQQNDAHCDLVVSELKSRSCPFIRLNREDLFDDLSICTDINSTKISKDGTRVDIEEINAIYARGFSLDELTPYPDGELNGFFKNETQAFIYGILLDHPRWFNHPAKSEFAAHKLIQLKRAKAAGFKIPETLVTNDPVSLQAFAKKHSRIINKVINQGRIEVGGQTKLSFARLLSKDSIDYERIEVLPSIYQEYIEKDFDIRVTVVNEHIFAVCIHSQLNKEVVDWRKERVVNIPHTEFNLPIHIKNKILEYIKSFDLNYGALDFVMDKKGELVFLELNPEGLWGWQEVLCNVKITRELVNSLISMASSQ